MPRGNNMGNITDFTSKNTNLNNLVLLIDYNKIQALSKLKDALPLNDLSKKLKSFNWNVLM